MKPSNRHALYWVWLAEICRPASRRAVRLLRVFENPERVFRAGACELTESGVVSVKSRIYADIMRHDLSLAKEIVSWCDKNGVTILTPESKEYPANFLSLMDAPLVLYVVGTLPDFSKRCALSVVGTRKMTEYGRVQSFRLGYALAKSGAIVVSGLAYGVDGLAMASAIEAGGTVVGIIGNGIDTVYPKEHAKLYRECASHGAVISEYAPGTAPSRGSFPQRNRLISALSQGTVVVEGDRLSGAMITARHAVYQGRDLFAVPGSVDSEASVGPNDLIREGAFAVTSARDILERYEFVYPHTLVPSLASLCLAGVDVKQSAVMTSLKYSTRGTLDAGSGRYSDASGSNEKKINASSIIMTSDTVEEKYIPRDIPKAVATKEEPEKGSNKKTKNKKRPAGFSPEAKEPVRIDFEMLTETDRKVYMAMIPDTPMLPDEIIVKGLGAKEIMSSLTLLEISGAVEAGAAGYYMRTGADDLSEL